MRKLQEHFDAPLLLRSGRRYVPTVKVGVNSDLMAMLEHSIPLGRAGTPEEAAGAAYLFCIPESDYVSRQTMLCTGGLTGM